MTLRWIAGRLSLATGGLIAGLAICEILLRLLGVSYFRFHLFDEVTGWLRPSGSTGWYIREGRDFIRINSAGLRDREHTLAKPPNTLRIAVLGDSYAEALQLPMETTFWANLERDYATCPGVSGRTVESINFGFSGFGTGQELLTLRHRGWMYDPDVVLLTFYLGNDLEDNIRELSGGGLRPFFSHRDGKLVTDDSFRSDPAFRLRSGAVGRFIYGWLFPNVRLLQVANEANASRFIQAEEARLAARGIGESPFIAPRSAAWQEAWLVAEDLLVQLRDEVQARNRTLLVAIIGHPLQAHPDPAVRERFRQSVGADDLDYPNKRLVAIGTRHGIPMVNLTPILRERAERDGRAVHGFGDDGNGHFNERGHQIASEAIAGALCQT